MSGIGAFVFCFGLAFALCGVARYRGARSVARVEAKAVVWLLAVGSGAALATIDLRSRAVGIRSADGLWLGFTAIVAAIAAFRCRVTLLRWPILMVVGATLFALLEKGQVALAPWSSSIPFVCAGVWVSLRLTSDTDTAPQRWETEFRAVLAVALTRALLTIPTSLPTRVPSALAAMSVVVMALGAFRAAAELTRRRLRRSATLVMAGAVSFTVVTGTTLFLAVRHARVASRHFAALKTATSAEFGGDPLLQLGRLKRDLEGVSRWLNHPLLVPAASFPVLRPNIALARKAFAHAESAVAAAVRAGNTVNALTAGFSTGLRLSDFEDIERDFSDIANSASSLLSMSGVTSRSRVNPWIIHRALNALDEVAPSLRAGATLDRAVRIPLLADLFGVRGTRRYLLVLPTPAEARGSGGVIGNYGEILASSEGVRLTRFGRAIDLMTNGIPPASRVLRASPDFVARYAPFGAASTWSNLTMSPNFPSAAEAMANLYPQSGGLPVDGVISADPLGLEALLAVVGPIRSSNWPVPVTSSNAGAVLLYESYVRLGGESFARSELLADVAKAAWAGIGSVKPSSVLKARRRLEQAVSGRHVQIWMRRPAEEAQIRALGISGAVPEVAGDSFGVVVNNATGSKLDWYLHRSINYEVHCNTTTGLTTAEATVVLRNDADPGSSDPDYVIGNTVPDVAVPRGTSRLYVSVYSVLPLDTWTLDGLPVGLDDTTTELGRRVTSAWVLIPSRSSVTIKVHFSGALPVGGYRLDVFRQPLVHADDLEVRLSLDRAMFASGQFSRAASPKRRVSARVEAAAVNTFSVLPERTPDSRDGEREARGP